MYEKMILNKAFLMLNDKKFMTCIGLKSYPVRDNVLVEGTDAGCERHIAGVCRRFKDARK
jgi:hypothetical protein